MDKQAILNTAVCYWSEDDDCFVVESPLLEIIAGVGETQQDAATSFERHLDTAYQSYLEGRMKHIYDRPGRPTKGNVAINADVNPKTRKQLKALARKLACTQGQLIDYLLFFYQKRSATTTINLPETNTYEALKSISADIQTVVRRRMDKIRLQAKRSSTKSARG